MATNRTVGLVTVIVLATLSALWFVLPSMTVEPTRPDLPGPPRPHPAESSVPDRGLAPVVDGRVLDEVGSESSPPVPIQWDRGDEPVPSSTWWSSAVVGPGATSLWPQPLALAIDASSVSVAAPRSEPRPDGSVGSSLQPALTLELGPDATTHVVDHGPLHVRLRIDAAGRAPVTLTLVQGSPLIEVETSEPLLVGVPGRVATDPAESDGSAVTVDTATGPWLVAADALQVTGFADAIELTPGPSGRLVLGPVPRDSGDDFVAAAQDVADHPLVDTGEVISVDRDGVTTQVLTQRRRGADADPIGLWALQPHHRQFGVALPTVLGTVPSAVGDVPVVQSASLRLRYPAVPVLWSAIPLPDSDRAPTSPASVSQEGAGSYFGGKAAYAAAARSDLFRSAGANDDAARSQEAAVAALDGLVDPSSTPRVRWDPRWGSAIVEPAEFGAGDQLNDHQLQYGYWVAAAAHVAEVDPDAAERHRDTVDLLIADFAGAATVPTAPTSLPRSRTWSPYEGHSWSSGTAPFADGNNLESISESSFASWAAARWFLATDRPGVAEVFLGRFTIESALTGSRWLPDGDDLPEDPRARPWSGVVWSGKVDLTTWFDPTHESALGIRLLPLGPASLARYATAEARAAAEARWDWCDAYAGGCTRRWANLLDSDAAVAGRPQMTGPEPEPSTGDPTSRWWRDLWDRSEPVDGWSCSPGAVPRRMSDGRVVVLASNPGPRPVELRCWDRTGAVRWSAGVRGSVVAHASR